MTLLCVNANPDEITVITWKTKQDLEIWPFLDSLLEKWVWESGPKIDPATGVRRNHSRNELSLALGNWATLSREADIWI